MLVILGCASSGQNDRGIRTHADLRDILSYASQKESSNIELEPEFEEISPLDSKKVSISVVNEDYRRVLFFICREINLNLLFDKSVDEYVDPGKAKITINLQNVSLREAIENILNLLDLDYKIEGNILKIVAIEEKFYHLEFLNYLRKSKFDIGGDVLGNQSAGTGTSTSTGSTGTAGEIVTPLKGNVELSGKTAEDDTDIYKMIEENIKSLVSPQGKFVLNKYTGVLYVRDYVKNLKSIDRFIAKIQEKYKRQVLIEAKILEVNLTKGNRLGIDWDAILRNDLKDTAYVSSNLSFLRGDSQAFLLNFKVEPYFDAVLRAIENHTTMKLIASPRIRALHGQPAMIGVGSSISYVREVDRETTAYEGVTTVQTTVDTSAVFDGLIFQVTPFINDDKSITLHIVPVKSDVAELRNIKFEDYEITLPEVNVRETSTVIKVRQNDLVVISGLISEKKRFNRQNVRGLSRLPVLGNLFQSRSDSSERVELIILLRARII